MFVDPLRGADKALKEHGYVRRYQGTEKTTENLPMSDVQMPKEDGYVIYKGVKYNSKSHDNLWAMIANFRMIARTQQNTGYTGKAGH